MTTYIQKLKLFTRNVRMVLIFTTFTGLTFGVFRLLFNFYVLSLGGYDEVFLGTLTSISSAASLAMALPAAYIAERFPRKRIMIITGFISALAILGLIMVPQRGFLILFNIVSGISMSLRQVAISPFLMDNTTQEERQYVFSFNMGLSTTAGFVGNIVGGMMPSWFAVLINAAPTDTISYRLALSCMVLVSMLAISPLLFIRGAKVQDETEIQLPWKLLAQHSSKLIKLILPNWVIGLGAGMLMPFMNIYYRNVFSQPDAIIGYLFASGALGMAIAQFIAPPLADRFGKIKTVVVTQALSIPFLLLLGFGAYIVPRGGNIILWFSVAWIAYLFRLALMNLSGPIYMTFVLEQVPQNVQALATSLNSIAFQFGWVLSPQLSGWLQANYSFVPVFLTTSTLYVIGISITWIFFHNADTPLPAESI